MKVDRRVAVLAVLASLLIVAAGYYYAVRPGAEKEFKYDVIKAMENLNEVMHPFWENVYNLRRESGALSDKLF